MVEVGPDVDLAAALYRNDGGDRPIPAIAIHAFVNTPEAIRLVETVAADRRLARADIEIQPGGIPAAITRYQGEATPNLLILETVGAAAELLAQIDELAGHCNPDIQVIVLGRANDIYLYRQLMLRGINEYLVPPVQPVQLIRAIGSLFADPEKPFVGKSVAVMGAKGGVGSSTLAHNLAWSLAEQCGVATTLVDLDLSFGTTALDFNQEAAQTVLDALAAPERADEAVLSRLIVKASEKLSLFVAPATVNTIHDLEPSAFDTVIEGVRRLTPFVVLDLPMQWNAWTRSTLVAADEVILVCAPDLASLRNGKNIADHLKSQRPNDAPPRLVLNMCGVPKRPEIPVKDFAQAIGIQPEIVLPFEPQLFGMATNNGQMIVDASREAKPSLAIRHLAGLLSGRMAAEPGKKSFLQKVLRK
jgi:pilus assembly protein CpaE